MTDDASFETYMAHLGVKPLDPSKPVQKLADQPVFDPFGDYKPPEDEDRALFLQALEQMPAKPLDKDSEPEQNQQALRKLKKSEKSDPMDVLDLHGLRSEQAIDALAKFVAHAFTHKRKSVMVITGKGLRSKGGKSVLKPLVEQWILKQGRYYLRAYAEAPRAYGGRGAFILYPHSLSS